MRKWWDHSNGDTLILRSLVYDHLTNIFKQMARLCFLVHSAKHPTLNLPSSLPLCPFLIHTPPHRPSFKKCYELSLPDYSQSFWTRSKVEGAEWDPEYRRKTSECLIMFTCLFYFSFCMFYNVHNSQIYKIYKMLPVWAKSILLIGLCVKCLDDQAKE